MRTKVISSTIELEQIISANRSKGLTIGFVPTMGALHEGHLSLIKSSKEQTDFTVCSIFVNPKQFNKTEDLEHYPRSLELDIRKLETVSCDLVFAPTENEIYQDEAPFEFDFAGLDQYMEGKFRSGHFKGVVRVVKRLFEIVRPEKAFFGLKDYQQFVIIQHLVRFFNLPIEVVGCQTVRERNGLALSSRNSQLKAKDIPAALELSKALNLIKTGFQKSNLDTIKQQAINQLEKHTKLEYLIIADSSNLYPLENWSDAQHARAFVAAEVSGVRLIDNVEIF
ncbi:MAG: pantoate--beta-alanine ligase [Crocinitomicaceae bacterium]|nr:pantoate--beta-alanine ligase [Crocinitomicaceae bacterium]